MERVLNLFDPLVDHVVNLVTVPSDAETVMGQKRELGAKKGDIKWLRGQLGEGLVEAAPVGHADNIAALSFPG